jgi:hypothetical protein
MSQEAIEIPPLDDKVIRIGTLCAVFFLSVFLVPYVQGFLNGKLGFSSTTGGRKKFTISTMIDVSSKVLQVSIVFVFICFGNIYLAWQNFFETENDIRLLVPICSYLFGIAMILLLWIPNSKYPSAHSALAILVFVSGTIFNTVIFWLYDKYYPENQTLSILRVNAFLAIAIFVVVVVFHTVYERMNQNPSWLRSLFVSIDILDGSLYNQIMSTINRKPPIAAFAIFIALSWSFFWSSGGSSTFSIWV